MSLNRQMVFDDVARHLIAQNRVSLIEVPTNRGSAAPATGPCCAYRSPDGCKCAIGALIPDDRYDPSIEQLRVLESAVHSKLDSRYGEVTSLGDLEFLNSLQGIHDSFLDRQRTEDEDIAARFERQRQAARSTTKGQWRERLLHFAANQELSPAAVLEAA
jgi:hypothetical protein